MDEQGYWAYCLADDSFFETPDRIADEGNRFAVANRAAPEGWRRDEWDMWVGLHPVRADLPAQGWKVHVSLTPAEAERGLDVVWDYCLTNGLSFKFLRSRNAVLLANAKYAVRGSSGKLVTLYPSDEAELAQVLTELGALLAGLNGPYVLGDLRIGDGPLYVRYGAFVEMWCQGDDDIPRSAIMDPHGNLVPDRRMPVFTIPKWMEMPAVLQPHLDAMQSGDGDLPCEVEKALHFSNAGGIYLARDRSGRRVVLREARPHAGLDGQERDAVTRLGMARTALLRLAGLDCVPRMLDYLVVHGHHFVVEEYVEGVTLLEAIQDRSPMVRPSPTARQIALYRAWAVDVLDQVEQALAAVHARGVRFGDLHPRNVLIRPDGRIAFIDFEFAIALSVEAPQDVAVPGFTPPPSVTGAAVDHYSLACLRLYLFTMSNQLVDLDRSKITTLVTQAVETEGMPAGFAPELIRTLNPAGAELRRDEAAELFMTETPPWQKIRDSLVAGIHASATPDRQDRLFPCGPAQFHLGGTGVAHGAAGVLFALHQVGAAIPEDYADWLVDAALRTPGRPSQGLYTGAHGIAAVLDMIGRHDEARAIFELARRCEHQRSSGSLFAGATGRALNLLHFAHAIGDDDLREAAFRVADEVAAALTASTDWASGRGLLRGPAGAAVLFLRLHEETGAARYLDLARLALRADLDRGEMLPDGTFQLRDGNRYLFYLDGGSAGVGLAVQEYLWYREDPELERILAGIRRGFSVPFVYQPGLFSGRAGVIALMAQLGADDDGAALREHVRRLGWQALYRDGNLVFPGEQLQRLSMDLAMGSAGVLLALHAAYEGTTALLPHLGLRSPAGTTNPGRR
ncbi:class III lanthionine synthetase LanKC [Lentzea sp. BCCO 10_0798]|uniref:Class III lanthionine synthetase LanKC n=1 Tax=Lentzea kristufekii TaxID=3095430 RepID=A0ABU4U1N2_9PSEU|nr:class III lanthionine synthetase LanKC [Lentzea sp. BCCO 10_0798]MDX8054483.1 class III lanthionine synthetase LanKC [Lentzea sp. BCCO 10_0798]